jgi:hypothetical protein
MERCTMTMFPPQIHPQNSSATRRRPGPATSLAVLAVAIATVSFVSPVATGVEGSGGSSAASSGDDRPGTRVLRSIVRVGRTFEVAPHSLAVNELLRCPAHTRLTGGGTVLLGEPSRPATAPIVYSNGPVGDVIAGEEQSWGSEVANRSDETFTFRQFALCATMRSIRFDD